MSAERIDHAARALVEYDAALEVMESEGITDGTVVASAVLAQVHATLALVEQQRIANLIALTRLSDDDMRIGAEDALFEPDPTLGHGKPWRVRPGIREALGLS